MASNHVGRTRDHLPRVAKSVSQSPATNMPYTSGEVSSKVASSNLKATDKCLGCGTQVKQLNKHLAWKPDCRKFYDEGALKMASLERRKESRKAYDLAHQKEIKSKKADYYKAKLQSRITIAPPENASLHAKIAASEGNLRHIPPAVLHKQHICSICEKSFAHLESVYRHLREVHQVYELFGQEKPKPIFCPSCKKTFSRKENMMHHIQTIHKKPSHTCSTCHKEFSREDHLQRHILDVHKVEKTFKCPDPDCPLSFSRKDTLDSHVKRASKNYKVHGLVENCSICNQDIIFPSYGAFKSHSWKKGNNFTCKTIEAEKKKKREAWAN